MKHSNQQHLTDDRLQELLDADLEHATDAERTLQSSRSHLVNCNECRIRFERWASLFEIIAVAPADPIPAIEQQVMSRLFPRLGADLVRAGRSVRRRPVRIPRWVPAAAVATLVASTAFSVELFTTMGMVTGPIVETAVASKLDTVLAPITLFTALLTVLSTIWGVLGGYAGAFAPVGIALARVALSEEVRSVVITSSVLYTLIALGWGARLLLARSRGGIHHVLLG